MKYIAVQWKHDKREPELYGHKAMRVIASSHPRFTEGTRFDYGFMTIASDQGYSITVLPSPETLDIKKWADMGEKS